MNENLREKAVLAINYLERMAEGTLPLSEQPMETVSGMNSVEVIRSLYFVRDVVKSLIEEENSKSKIQRKAKQSFPVECLENFVYESDKSIMTFVKQLKDLTGNPEVKGLGTKKITDWLKAGGYLQDLYDEAAREKKTIITDKGIEAGLYSETRHTRLGQEYDVIMYSEKAQMWIVDHLSTLR